MKEIVFIVTWILVTITPDIAPLPTENEYGISSRDHSTTLAVYRFERSEEVKEKEFKTEKEADEFIKKMPLNETVMIGTQYCKSPVKKKVVITR